MNKFGLFLIGLLAITLVSCTNQSKKEVVTQQEENKVNQTVIDSHTSDMALDWAGEYDGTLPCADCEGIETVIELKKDHTYVAHYKYIGKPEPGNEYSQNGTFSWDDTGSIITLESEDETTQYAVGENKLTLMTQEGNLNTGKLKGPYVLSKKM